MNVFCVFNLLKKFHHRTGLDSDGMLFAKIVLAPVMNSLWPNGMPCQNLKGEIIPVPGHKLTVVESIATSCVTSSPHIPGEKGTGRLGRGQVLFGYFSTDQAASAQGGDM